MTYELFFRMKDIASFTWQLNDGEEITPTEDTYTQDDEIAYIEGIPWSEHFPDREYITKISWVTLTIEDSSD